MTAPQNFNILSVANGGTGVSSAGSAGSVAMSDGKTWTAQPPSLFKAHNTSTTPQALAASTTGVFPAGFFNTTTYITADLTYSGGKLTVAMAATYLVRVNAFFTTAPLLGTWYLTVLKNGVVQEMSQNFNGATVADSLWIIPCSAKDVLQPGYVSTVAASAAGNTSQISKMSFWQACRT